MTRAWALAVVVCLPVGTAAAEPCAPHASLDGDAAAVASVAVELRRLGVRTDGDARGCRTIVAAVELDRTGGIAVAVRDGAQRSEGRVVGDAALAAAWIDSWVRDDFETPIDDMLVVSTPITAPERPVAIAPERPFAERFSLAGAFEQTWTFDNTTWSGVSASVCTRAGAFCIGGRGRYAREDVNGLLTAAKRIDASLLATASYAMQIGQMSIAPELGVGIGMTTTTRIEGCMPSQTMCDPMDPNCIPPPEMDPCKTDQRSAFIYVGDNLSESTVTPRLAAGLRLAVPLFEHVWLDGIASLTLAPFAHTETFQAEVKPTTVAPGDIALPGESSTALQLGIGLRLGMP